MTQWLRDSKRSTRSALGKLALESYNWILSSESLLFRGVSDILLCYLTYLITIGRNLFCTDVALCVLLLWATQLINTEGVALVSPEFVVGANPSENVSSIMLRRHKINFLFFFSHLIARRGSAFTFIWYRSAETCFIINPDLLHSCSIYFL